MKRNLIAISGQPNSGKDTVYLIINWLLQDISIENIEKLITDTLTWNERFSIFQGESKGGFQYRNRKFATALKECCSILTGTRLEQWEDREFKDSLLGQGNGTAREFMQDVAEKMREINSDIFVNALFTHYSGDTCEKYCNKLSQTELDGCSGREECVESSWIITDLRYPNELQAVQKRNGLLIRIERDVDPSNHLSNIALNDFTDWDYIISNDGTLLELIEKVKQILIKEVIL